MSYSAREMGEPSTVATGAGAALSATAGAAACCWPFPHAAINTTMAVTMDARVHGVLKNWVICFLYAKKKRLRPKAYAPGGGSLALNSAISPIFCLRLPDGRDTCCAAAMILSLRYSAGGRASIASA